MQMQRQQQNEAVVRYRIGDIVLYRDPEAFWLGLPGHTRVCRVVDSRNGISFDLVEAGSNQTISRVRPCYMRLLPAAEAMRDIDTAPLREPDATAMSPASVAWLRQQVSKDGRPALPPGRD
ncbi:hypothetical protein QLX52_30600 [Streptomyces albus]|uniref:hypothetical protein n=1 Tax=Streptomyces albus TaxID=1888 RepID=UPI0024ADDED7|nr:hypothetical protein [Streptomyces albus]MDI6413160.1 hypothetical protein [Streptomyces albus]